MTPCSKCKSAMTFRGKAKNGADLYTCRKCGKQQVYVNADGVVCQRRSGPRPLPSALLKTKHIGGFVTEHDYNRVRAAGLDDAAFIAHGLLALDTCGYTDIIKEVS